MAVAYLDIDDEITSAAERIRGGAGTALALVLPPGSRLATSRLNFRLLAREAERYRTRLTIVSADPATRAVAEAAGLLAFDSVARLSAAPETALETAASRATPSVRGSTGIGIRRAGAAPDTDGGAAGRTAAAERVAAAPDSRDRRGRGVGRRVIGGAGIVGLVAVLAFGGYAGSALVSSATVTLVVRPTPLDALAVTVTADPAAVSLDVAAGVFPAERRSFPLAASGSFPASGIRVSETVATGIVRWQNCDPTRAYAVPARTTVRTKTRVAFSTDEAVFLPVATLTGRTPKLTCQSRDVGVTARAPGLAGNVAAGTIEVVPALYNSVVIRVANPAATSGGTRTETPVVERTDVDAALAALTKQLDEALVAEVQRLGVAEGSEVAYPATASRSDALVEPSPAGLVGAEVDAFELALAATGSVLIVDPAPIATIAEERLSATVPEGRDLVPGSVTIEVGEGIVKNGVVVYQATVTGQAVATIGPEIVRRAVAGRPLPEARAALAAFGEGTIELWPDFVTTLPSSASERLSIDVRYEGVP